MLGTPPRTLRRLERITGDSDVADDENTSGGDGDDGDEDDRVDGAREGRPPSLTLVVREKKRERQIEEKRERRDMRLGLCVCVACIRVGRHDDISFWAVHFFFLFGAALLLD